MEKVIYDFGMIGLGVMGSNLLQNMAGHGYKVIGYDKDVQKTVVLSSLSTPTAFIKGVASLEEMVEQLSVPRKIMMLVPAGKPVDSVIEALLPLLKPGDIIIDGGNSFYLDTLRRVKFLKEKSIHFMGMGISGGEHGARTGPSMMPGGDKEAYEQIKPLLESIAAKEDGEPCTAYMGKDAAGHYVKMVHNGIEYAIMQLISEIYNVLKHGLDLSNDDLHEVFKKWHEGELESFLIAITRDIFLQQDDLTDNRQIDVILDKAGSKGTGKWTSQEAMNLPVSIPTIDMAVSMRSLSVYKEERNQAAELHQPHINKINTDKEEFIHQAGEALYAGMIVCYVQGLTMLHKASEELNMDIPLQDVVKVWRRGCIIRSALLRIFYKAFEENKQLPNLLLNTEVAELFKSNQQNLRNVIISAVQSNISVSGLMSVIGYYDAYVSKEMPVNLIQAQRDYFGAHTYQRIDMPGVFHTEWQIEYADD